MMAKANLLPGQGIQNEMLKSASARNQLIGFRRSAILECRAFTGTEHSSPRTLYQCIAYPVAA
jgi:hypothetical protein